MTHYKAVVVGAGMMGASAAKYLADALGNVALIGPGEPEDISSHQGVFASHYDAARITRTIDPDADWALLANRSIARYAQIEAESGIQFYHEAGCLVVGPQPGGASTLIDDVLDASRKLRIHPETMDEDELSKSFGYFRFEEGSRGVFEKANAGHINPRLLVKAQKLLAAKAGAELIDHTVVSVEDRGESVELMLSNGDHVTADRVLIACGGFTNADKLLPQKLKLNVYGRTIALFPVKDEDAHLFKDMPSLIYDPQDVTKHIYLLPPVRYPDGKLYLKIGGEPGDRMIDNDTEMRAWFRSGGDEAVRQHLMDIVKTLVPQIKQDDVLMSACVVSYTPSGYPAIGFTSTPRIAVMTGGCGAAAKSCDEIGRLGAELILTDRIQEGPYQTDFAPEFA
jgi:sarcosine oxidase